MVWFIVVILRMIQHIKKLFLGMIVLTCFTCFQRADYNLPLFAFSFFLWDYKHPNVLLPHSATKNQTLLLVCLHLDRWLHLARLLGSHLELRLVPAQWVLRDLIFRPDPLSRRLPPQGTPALTQLAIIIILYLFDPECKTTIKNIIPNIKSIFNPQAEKLEGVDEWLLQFWYILRNAQNDHL